MLTQITDTQLDDATHTLALALTNIGINLGDGNLSELNDTLSSFLNEHCCIKVISDESAHDDSAIQIREIREISCNAKEDITYEIQKDLWASALLDSDGNEVEALLALQEKRKVKRLDYSCEVGEVNAEFDVDVEEV
jgi:hypothetical protein